MLTNRSPDLKSWQMHERRNGAPSLPQEMADEILRTISAIRYGSVEVVIHAGARWTCRFVDAHYAGRIDADAGYGDWPAGERLFARLRSQVAIADSAHARSLAA